MLRIDTSKLTLEGWIRVGGWCPNNKYTHTHIYTYTCTYINRSNSHIIIITVGQLKKDDPGYEEGYSDDPHADQKAAGHHRAGQNTCLVTAMAPAFAFALTHGHLRYTEKEIEQWLDKSSFIIRNIEDAVSI